MTKHELSEKWSKYCNTDKLVDDAIELLINNDHRCSEHGVCVLLDTYFTNKEPLIKLFMTSKHYIGDMRIAVAKEFDRDIDKEEIRRFFNNIYDKLHTDDMLEYTDKKGKTMFDYLLTGKKTFNIADLPNATAQKKKLTEMQQFNLKSRTTADSYKKSQEFGQYMIYFRNTPCSTIPNDYQVAVKAPILKAGTKTSRAFNKVCTYYGVDKLHPETVTVEENGTTVEKTTYPYNKVFAEYADMVSTLKRKMQFIISLNPLDYLTMSDGVNWHSCHNIYDGCYKAGTISYMLDTTSIVTFVAKEINDDIHKIPKVYRQMYHYKDNLFIQSRLYPQGNDGATNLYDQFRGYVIKEFSSLIGANGEWTYECGTRACTTHINSRGKHYRDYNYNANVGIFYPTSKEFDIQSLVMTVGHESICVNCGRTFNESARYLTHQYISSCEM